MAFQLPLTFRRILLCDLCLDPQELERKRTPQGRHTSLGPLRCSRLPAPPADPTVPAPAEAQRGFAEDLAFLLPCDAKKSAIHPHPRGLPTIPESQCG